MQVLEDQQQRTPGAEPAEQPEDQLEKLRDLDPVPGGTLRSVRVEFRQ